MLTFQMKNTTTKPFPETFILRKCSRRQSVPRHLRPKGLLLHPGDDTLHPASQPPVSHNLHFNAQGKEEG